jgi:hypothetical protein
LVRAAVGDRQPRLGDTIQSGCQAQICTWHIDSRVVATSDLEFGRCGVVTAFSDVDEGTFIYTVVVDALQTAMSILNSCSQEQTAYLSGRTMRMDILNSSWRPGRRKRSSCRCRIRGPHLIVVAWCTLVGLRFVRILIEIEALVPTRDRNTVVSGIVPVLSCEARVTGVDFRGTIVVRVCTGIKTATDMLARGRRLGRELTGWYR